MHRYFTPVAAMLTVATALHADDAATIAKIKDLGGYVLFEEKEAVTTVCLQGRALVTPSVVKELSNFKQLKVLEIRSSDATAAVLKEVKELKQLQSLVIFRCALEDAGLKEIQQLTQLKKLAIKLTAITDSSLKELKELKQLQELSLSSTKITGNCLPLPLRVAPG